MIAPHWMNEWIKEAAAESLEHLSPGLRREFKKKEWRQFEAQLAAHLEELFRLLHHLYGWRYDFAWILEAMVATAAEGFLSRPRVLRRRDRLHGRGSQSWINEQTTVWAVSEISPFAGIDSKRLIDQLRALGVTHLHLLPDPEWANELGEISQWLTGKGISVVLDLSTDRLQSVLNGHDPEVLAALCRRMLRLANLGAAAIHLDGDGFLRTSSEAWDNDLDIHLMIQVMRVVADISAPTIELVFEPGSGDRDGSTFVNPNECRLGHYVLFGSELGEALDTAHNSPLRLALTDRPHLPEGCNWLTSLPSHQGAAGPVAPVTGLEEAVEAMDPLAIDLAARRLLAYFSVMLGEEGIPVIFLTDADANFSDVAYQGILRLLELRRTLPGLHPSLSPELLDAGDQSVIAFRRGPLLVAVNLSHSPVVLDRTAFGVDPLVDLVSGEEWGGHILGPYEYRWLSS